MSRESLSLFLAKEGVRASHLFFQGSVHTVEEAAREACATPDDFIKTIVVSARKSDKAAVCIVPGTKRLSMEKASELVGEKVTIASPETVLEKTGYPVGGVPPVFDNSLSKIPVFIDESLLRKGEVIGGGGDAQSLIRIPPSEIVRVMGASPCDLSS